ncbi:hypothetical protein C499_18674 [Halogeometricum borinquense DSM 11551]|uniref:Uncharacterized protein n=2 Tax=Halogeometricum borinquense TaxID=60847 RepID=E4NNQ0_HALBP|nr:hypothetical protein [Halogeometricum borinquense]ADQ67514.1 hypothetical protein Hbor_19470 [Halogeometricum borinquense DSM 11551]ELY23804.1 hypothetical protein C499_18674 [Halogeometricum borinquense DSM 11551]RYJ13515.1 hypothetical protein ELS19_05775 [Halogeometricum borinquense]
MASLPFPVPSGFPFDLCTPTPNGTQLCVQTGSIQENIGEPRDCNDGQTPPLVSVDLTYQEKTISLGDAEVLVENSIWIGIEEDLNAVWVGEPKSGSCYRHNLNNIDPTAALDTVLKKAGDAADASVRDLGMNPNSGPGQVLALIIMVVLFLIADGAPDPV